MQYHRPSRHGLNADVAQLVEHHLAKVDVASSNLVVRSERPSQVRAGPTRWSGREARQRPAKPCTRVQIPSPPRRKPRAIGAAGARFLDTEEVTGSIPVSPTRSRRVLLAKAQAGLSFSCLVGAEPSHPGQGRGPGPPACGPVGGELPQAVWSEFAEPPRVAPLQGELP